MQTKPLVSILIPAHNSGKWIRETILSALAQTWDSKEIIIVDDGSTDNTLAIAQAFEKEGVKLFSQPNRGASAARNKAFAEATGSYIQYLDADDLLAPDKITLQMELLEGKSKLHISSSAWSMFFDRPGENALRPTALWKDYDDPVEWLVNAWTKSIWMPNMSWLASRQLIQKAGGWDETLSLHDDGEFFSRVLLASEGILFCKEAVSYYRKGLSGSLSQQRTESAEQSRFRVYELYEKHLLSVKNTPQTRSVCAGNYQKFIYRVYPRFPGLMAKAEMQVKRLGGSDMKLKKHKSFNALAAVFGWKRATLIENFLLKKGWMPHQLKKRLVKK